MYKTLKKQSLKAALPRIAAALAAALILLAATGFGIFNMLAGARELTADSLKSGGYVSFDLSRVIVGYASASDSAGNTAETYYILELGDGLFASLSAGPGYDELLSPALEQAEAYYRDGTLDALAELGTATGTVTALGDREYGFLQEGLDSSGLEGETLQYNVVLGRAGFLQKGLTVGLSCAALCFVLWAAIEIAAALAGVHEKKARALAESVCTPAEAEADFAGAEVFDRVRVGKRLCWYRLGEKSRCFPTGEALWAFNRLDSRMLGARRWSLYVYLRDGSLIDIRTKAEAGREPIALSLREHGAPLACGYTAERAELFARDRAGFEKKYCGGGAD